ncbi:MAG: peptidoglycan editing factor PgeF [Burkholderiales bacterium]|nr:peptidoglycan editing factor PgeF [Burkholderiales bacterium]
MRNCDATPEVLVPDWPAPERVRALVTTRALGDLAEPAARARLRARLPAEPVWLEQVHGAAVVEAGPQTAGARADASFARAPDVVCAVRMADCLPVLLAADDASVVGVAHAGWRGLAAGVIEATVAAIGAPPARLLAWLGPAIGPLAYEVGEEVRAAFVARDRALAAAFAPSRPGHWRLDLYAAARRRLAAAGVERVFGGGFCTYAEATRFFSWRRERTSARMAALVWLARGGRR